MSLSGILKSDLLSRVWTPLSTQVRYRNRINFKHPIPVHYKRARVIAVTKPVYPGPLEVCGHLVEKKKDPEVYEDHKYATYLARKMLERFDSHLMIAIFHVNPCKMLELLKMRGMLFDAGFEMRLDAKVNTKVAKMALGDTKYEPVLRLVQSRTGIGYCSSLNVPKLLKVIKKMPQFILIGLVMENRLLHRADIDKVAKMTDITAVRASLCHTLQLSAASLSRSLLANTVSLSTSLSSLSTSLTENRDN